MPSDSQLRAGHLAVEAFCESQRRHSNPCRLRAHRAQAVPPPSPPKANEPHVELAHVALDLFACSVEFSCKQKTVQEEGGECCCSFWGFLVVLFPVLPVMCCPAVNCLQCCPCCDNVVLMLISDLHLVPLKRRHKFNMSLTCTVPGLDRHETHTRSVTRAVTARGVTHRSDRTQSPSMAAHHIWCMIACINSPGQPCRRTSEHGGTRWP